MKITDLTQIISPNMPVFPGDEKPFLKRKAILEKDGFREMEISLSTHTGTHIDAPAHILENGPFLDNMNVGHFIGKAVIIDFSKMDETLIETDFLKSHEERIKTVDFVVIKTGWSRYWGEESYYSGFPSLSEEAAEWLAEFNLKGVGIDAISIDDIESTTLRVHKKLLSKNIIIIENMTNLDSVCEDEFLLSVMPLKVENADGSPVRAVSIENIR